MFKLWDAQKPSQETKEGRTGGTPTSRQRDDQASSSTRPQPKAPNSAQRRSARRKEKFLLAKKSPDPAQGSEAARSVEPPAAGEARVETDALKANEPMEATATAQDAPGHAVGESPAPMQVCVSAAQDSQVESTGRSLNGRRGPGLKPLDPEERKAQKRRDGARDARPNTRWDR